MTNTRTTTHRRHGATFRKAGWLAAGAMLAVAALAPATVGAADVWATVTGYAAGTSDNNHVETWGDDCTKIDFKDPKPETYTLANSYDWVIVKAGSENSAPGHVNTLFQNALAGQIVWADSNGSGTFNTGDKEISHIIFCGPGETTTSTTRTTTETTDQTTETTDDSTTETTDQTTETVDSSTETTDQTTETVDSSTETTDQTTETVDSSTETVDSTTETTDETTDETTTETTDQTTETSDTTTETTDSTTTTTSTGDELGAEGTPGVTPPPTDTVRSVAQTSTTDGFRMLLVGFALLLGMALFLLPKEVATKEVASKR